MGRSVGVCLLGPIEIWDDSGSSPVVGTKLQTLLAMLALAVPQPVSDDRLLEGLWGADQPSNPANALQALVSHLRRLLGREVVERRGSGYVLSLPPDSVDAARLERLVHQGHEAAARGDHRTAEQSFATAISLGRGPPLGELADAWFAREAAARLGEVIVSAHESWAASALAMGHHDDVVVPLTDLVAEHPARERLRAQLMVALYRCGRQGDALHVYRDARRYLLDELGLDPGPELDDVQRAVLAHDPRLASPIVLTTQIPVRAAPPMPLTSFVGRHDEMATLSATIERLRMVTILGPAGVGKTRLALEFARHATREVIFIELASVPDAAGVAEAVADAVGAYERGADGETSAEPLARTVGRIGLREVVVVLDNCEHVAAAAAVVAGALLAGCARIRVAATSREPLGVDGEHQVLVGPLDVVASAQLFVDRARAVQPHFETRTRDGSELAELCRHLDGLPLAIELAAARTKTLPLPEISARLQDRFRLLRRSVRTGSPRHEGLRAAIDWSHELLFTEERRVFRRLAVFAGGATIEAAEAICGPDAFETASRLVDRSLLIADTSGDEVRFGMLESLRDYAWSRLVEAGELDDARTAHLAWCTALAAQVNAEARGADQLSWLARLDREHDNMRSALAFAVECDPRAALQLSGDLFLPWWFRGRRQEMRQWTIESLAAAPDEPSINRARALANQGFIAERGDAHARPGDMEEALELAERRQRQAVRMAEDLGEHAIAAFLQLFLLSTMTRRAAAGAPFDAVEFGRMVEESYAAFDRENHHYGAGSVRVTEAVGALVTNDLSAAERATDGARQHAGACGDRYLGSRVEYLLGVQADLAGDPGRAYQHAERSLRLQDELGIHESVTAQARLLATYADRCGQPELATQWRSFVANRSGSWSYFDGTVFAAAHNQEGLRARRSGDLDRADASHTTALQWYAQAGLQVGAAFSESCLGFLATEVGDAIAAERHHRAALAAAAGSTDGPALALALEGMASVMCGPTAAARLLGAAEGLRTGLTASGEPSHRDDVGAVRLGLRSVLGADAFDVAARSGRNADVTAMIILAGTIERSRALTSRPPATSGACQPRPSR